MVKIPGGTMTIAEAAAGGPNYLFPMMGGAYFSVANFQLIYMLYRPLYWFGVGNTPDLNPSLSVADAPVYTNHGRTVTIKMKGYKWSNGESCRRPGHRLLDEHAEGERHLLGRPSRPARGSFPVTSQTSSPTARPTRSSSPWTRPTARTGSPTTS